jgi:histidinol-phosphatase (PHP family)
MPADYVREALRDGARALGISDHCPYPDDATWRGSRMACADVPRYIELVRAEKARSPFPFFWGFECEWHPAFESWYRDYLRSELGAEYLVYGSHWISDAGEFYYIPEVAEERFLGRYVDLTIAGLRTGLYDFLAHPDLFLAGYTHFTADVRLACRDIIDAAIAMDLPLEVNGLGLEKPAVMGDQGPRAPYPVREFWEMASSMGAVIICNSDAHRAEDAIAGALKARAFITGIGITPVDAFDALPFAAPRAQ